MIAALGVIAVAQSNWPRLPYSVDPDWPRLPVGWTFEETPGVAVDAREHVFVFHRGKHSIIEFDKSGNVVRAWGDGTFVRPHGLRFDPEGNLWAADDQGHIVVKMDALGRVRMVLGRKNTKGETNDTFNRPTDLAFTPSGDFTSPMGMEIARREIHEGRKFIAAWGKKGAGEGEFNLPHAVRSTSAAAYMWATARITACRCSTPMGSSSRSEARRFAVGIAILPDETIYMCDGTTTGF
jgi:hypothetical protein